MKCLHCGNEPDRFSKWKGSSEFCSEECRKASLEESDKLAMRRLMQPRRATTVQRAAPSTVSRNEGAVAVAEPARPQGPEAPPEAEFLWANEPMLAVLQLRSHPYTAPRPLDLCMPETPGAFSDDLAALAESVKPSHPAICLRRPWPASWAVSFSAVPGFAWTDEPAVSVEPEWRASLGYAFSIVGLDSPLSSAPAISALIDGPPASLETLPASLPAPDTVPSPVSHKAIPALRPRLDYTQALDHQIPVDVSVPEPAVVAPRLRIHLPKPQILPLRPRYGFAPKPEDREAKAAPKAEAKETAKVEAKETPKVETKAQPKEQAKEPVKENAAQLAARRAQELKDREASRIKQIPSQPPKAKVESKKEEARKSEPVSKPEAKKQEAKKEETLRRHLSQS